MRQLLFERRTTRRIPARHTAAILKQDPRRKGDGQPVVDLSLHGLCLESDRALPAGQGLIVEVRHPHLKSPPPLPVRVVWSGVSPGTTRARVGMEFTLVSVAQRSALRRFLAAEAGSCVLEGASLIGFLMPVAEGVWTLFDPDATKVAMINREDERRHQVCLRGSDPRGAPRYMQTETFQQAVSLIYQLGSAPRFEPPLDGSGAVTRAPAAAPPPPPPTSPPPPPPQAKPQPAPQPPPPPAFPKAKPKPAPEAPPPPAPWDAYPKTRQGDARPTLRPRALTDPARPAAVAGHCIRDAENNIMGYAALTGDQVWSLYDPEMEQIGVLSKAGGSYTVFWLGGSAAETSFISVKAQTFPAALGMAFEMDSLPGLSPAVITPAARTSEAPQAKPIEAPGSRVLFRRRLVGYECESAIENTWATFNKEMEQTAIVARDMSPPQRYRVCWMGSSAEESMEYMVHESLLGAVASAFHLPSAPLLDPPLEE